MLILQIPSLFQLKEAIGRISADLIAPYPPGVAVVAPGEVLNRSKSFHGLATTQKAGVRIAYASDATLGNLSRNKITFSAGVPVHSNCASARKPSLGQMLTVVMEQGDTSMWKMLSAGAPTTTFGSRFDCSIVGYNRQLFGLDTLRQFD